MGELGNLRNLRLFIQVDNIIKSIFKRYIHASHVNGPVSVGFLPFPQVRPEQHVTPAIGVLIPSVVHWVPAGEQGCVPAEAGQL